jgi:Icc-related predicted phosphoesterase
MTKCYFVSDLHGRDSRWQKLFARIENAPPEAVFIGGDIMPFGNGRDIPDVSFISEYLYENLSKLKGKLGGKYPQIFIIPGNDDPAMDFDNITALEAELLLQNIHNTKSRLGSIDIYGYAMIPPSPFQLKDWEKYDVSRYADPGCIHPTDGIRSKHTDKKEILYSTIADDLEELTGDNDLSQSIFLFHSPPYETSLDRAANDGKSIDHVPLDLHVGSIAIRRFIESRQPMLTLHGHIHEAARITGSYWEMLGNTLMLQGAHDGGGLSLITFDAGNPADHKRELI